MVLVHAGLRAGHPESSRLSWDIVFFRSHKTLCSLQTIHIPGPLFNNRPYNLRPFFAAVFPSQALENEYFSVARAACKCVN